MSGTVSKARQNPYVGPRAFEKGESDFFFGRGEETEILAGLVKAHRDVLFFAPSGAGKTSLLRAGLIPKLTARKKISRGRRIRTYQQMRVLPILSVGGGIPGGMQEPIANIYVFGALLSLLPEAAPDDLAGISLADGLAPFFSPATDTPPSALNPQPEMRGPELATLLILDQFEELFTHHPGRWQEREDFFGQVDDALRTYRKLHVLISMREDFIAELTPYANLLPEQLRSRFRLERLKRAAALEAVQRPAARAGCPFDEGVAEDLVDNLSGAKPGQASADLQTLTTEIYVEPVHLQIVCHQLWENLPPDRATILAEDVRAFGDVDQALIGFYESTLDKALKSPGINLSQRRLRTWFDEHLITPALTRGLVFREDGETAGLPNEAVDILYEAFIIRAVKRGDDTWYELAHDRLVTPILKSNAAWLSTYYNPLAKATQAWLDVGRSPRNLIRGSQLQEAKAYASTHPEDVTETEARFLAESERALNPLAAAAQIWLDAGRDPLSLLSGRQLEEARTYARDNPEDVVGEENEFLAASVRQFQAQQELERQAARRRRIILVAGLAVLIGMAVLTAWALFNANRATRARDQAISLKANADAASIRAIEQQQTAEAERDIAATAQVDAGQQKVTAEAARVVAVEQQRTAEAERDLAANAQATAVAERDLAATAEAEAEAERDLAAALADSLKAILPTETPTATPTATKAAAAPVTPTGALTPAFTATPTAIPTATPITTPTPPPNQTAAIETAQAQLARVQEVRATQTAEATPSFPPSGRIIFVRAGEIGDLYLMQGDGSGVRPLTTKTAFEPSSAQDGGDILIAFASTRTRKRSGDPRVTLFTMRLGDPEGNQIPDRGPDWDNWEPSLSPDGKRVAFVTSRDNQWEIYAMNLDGSRQERLTNDPGRDWAPTWSPDGKQIAFVSDRNGQPDIWLMNADGSDPVPLTSDPAQDDYPAWSPDGKQIAFASNRDGNFEIYVMDRRGLNQRNLTKSAYEDNFPAWSLDGQWLAFSRHMGGNNEIFIMTVLGGNQTNLTEHPADDWAPIWIP